MDSLFHHTLYWTCDYLSMLGLKYAKTELFWGNIKNDAWQYFVHTWHTVMKPGTLPSLYLPRRRRLTGTGTHIINLRRSDYRLRFIIGIPVLKRLCFLMTRGPAGHPNRGHEFDNGKCMTTSQIQYHRVWAQPMWEGVTMPRILSLAEPIPRMIPDPNEVRIQKYPRWWVKNSLSIFYAWNGYWLILSFIHTLIQ